MLPKIIKVVVNVYLQYTYSDFGNRGIFILVNKF